MSNQIPPKRVLHVSSPRPSAPLGTPPLTISLAVNTKPLLRKVGRYRHVFASLRSAIEDAVGVVDALVCN